MADKSQLILQGLDSSDSEVRISAIKQVPLLDEPSINLFARALGDSDWRVRKAAIEAFFQLKHPESFLAELLIFLHHPENAGLRNAAIEILIGLGPLALEALLGEVDCPDVEVRKFVIDILGEIGDSRCSEKLISALSDSDINIRYAAAETLGKLNVESAVEPLLELMTDPDPGLKFTVLQSLAQIDAEVPAQRLFSFLDERLIRKALFDCFAKIGGEEVIPPLVDGLTDPMRQVREAALEALFELNVKEKSVIREVLTLADAEKIASHIESIFSGENLHLKMAALAIYGAVGASRDLRPLLPCVADEQLRPFVLEAFAELGSNPFGRLLNTLKSPDQIQLISLIYLSGELGFAQGLSLASDGAVSLDPQLKFISTRALGRLAQKEQLGLLLALLDDEGPEIQDAAAEAIVLLGQRHKEAVLGRIVPLLADPDAPKRMRAVRILGMLNGQGVETQLLIAFKDSSSSVRCEAIRGLSGRMNDSVFSGVSLALTDESSEVRRLAVATLAKYPQVKSLAALTLAAEDSDIWVRSAVFRALQVFNGDEVRELLRVGVADPVGVVAIAALETSVSLWPDESRELLEQALGHPDEEVVKSAMNLLGRLLGSDWINPFTSALLNHLHWDVRVHAVRAIGNSPLDTAPQLLADRLQIEEDDLVRQAIETSLSCRVR